MKELFLNIYRRLFSAAGGISYRIGGKVYRQRPLVLLQVEQLAEFLGSIQIPPGATVTDIVRTLGDRLSQALAIVLIPEGVEVDQKDLPAISEHLRKYVDIDTAVRVVNDFLSCNPVASVFDRLTGVLGKGINLLAVGSPSSSASSPPAT